MTPEDEQGHFSETWYDFILNGLGGIVFAIFGSIGLNGSQDFRA